MQAHTRKQKRFFWLALIIGFVISGGCISATSATANAGHLIISEIMAANGSGLVDENGQFSDWIEMYNPGSAPINLSGWSLTNDPNQPQQWEFPDMTLGGGEYLVVFASGKDRTPTQAGQPLHTNFKLSKGGEFLALYSVLEDRFMDVVGEPFPRQFRDVSFGRTADKQSFGYMPHPTPGAANNLTQVWLGTVEPVTFSLEHGFYDAPVAVKLTTITPDALVRYTTDGSEPTLSNGLEYTDPININQSTVLRAAAFKPQYLGSEIGTQTYLFANDVIAQLTEPLRLPGSNDMFGAAQPITNHAYPVRDSLHRIELSDSLQSIPSLSVVMPEQQLHSLTMRGFDQRRAAERPASIELLNPASALDDGFQINAGIRPFGDEAQAKQSFQLYFRGEYGQSDLTYPIFDDSTVTTFDTLILQAVTPGQNITDVVRSTWLHQTQQEMSGLAVHQKFVQLYLNGQYWGLYQLGEKPGADFMATYVGGEARDWFVADQNGPRSNGATVQAETLDSLFSTLALAARVDESLLQPALFANSFTTFSTYFDPARFSDFVLLNAFARTQNWPENNWLAAVRLNDLPGRGKLLIGAEQPAGAEQPSTTIGESVPDAPARSAVFKMLFNLWMENPDFQVTFADRLFKNVVNDGPLAAANAQARWDNLSKTLAQATAAELARWGGKALADADRKTVQLARPSAELLAMARASTYYPELDPPIFSRSSGLAEAGETVSMRLPDVACDGCRIYYTTDGTDPRLSITGEVIPTAQEYRRPIELTDNMHLKARVWQVPPAGSNQPTWSALNEVDLSVMQQDNHLRITEVMYNPPNGDDYEYIELYNAGSIPVRMVGVTIDDGIRYKFAANAPPLMPGEYAVLASNPTALSQQYPGVTVWGAYEGHLSNKGEQFSLRDSQGELLLEMRYDDENGWPVSADGRGDSLTLAAFDGNPGDPRSWRASDELYGTPGF